MIGDYARPKVRLPGSGGACESAQTARKVFAMMPQSIRSFVERLDFPTRPGHVVAGRPPWMGAGPTVVVTGLGVHRFDNQGEMVLESVHPGVTVEQVRENTGWDLKVSERVGVTPPPSEEELRIMREELDPAGAYTR